MNLYPNDKNVISATTDYSSNIVCSVEKENIFGTQFHPEKSDKLGLKLLKILLILMFNYLTKLPFLKRLIPSITTRYYKLSKGNKNFFKVGNIKFYLDYLDPLDRKMIIYQKYEDDQVRYLEDQMNKVTFSNFIDIGANSGYYSFYFANKFKNLQIKAFEPNIDAFNKLKKTLSKNSFKNVEIFNFGLSDKDRKVKIRSMIKNGFVQSNSAILDTSDNFNKKDFEIKDAIVKVGDNIFNFKDKKLIIKIDVEGHEVLTLNGLTNNLKNNYCLLLIEISERNYNKVNTFLEIINYKKIFKSKYRSDYIYTNI